LTGSVVKRPVKSGTREKKLRRLTVAVAARRIGKKRHVPDLGERGGRRGKGKEGRKSRPYSARPTPPHTPNIAILKKKNVVGKRDDQGRGGHARGWYPS